MTLNRSGTSYRLEWNSRSASAERMSHLIVICIIKLMTLKPRDFLKLKVEIPASLEEQKIIADFLMKFDETIDAEQKRIEKWKELKKGLLQQMFV